MWPEALAALASLQLIYSEAYFQHVPGNMKCGNHSNRLGWGPQSTVIFAMCSRKRNLANYKNTCLCLLSSGWTKAIPLRSKNSGLFLGVLGIQTHKLQILRNDYKVSSTWVRFLMCLEGAYETCLKCVLPRCLPKEILTQTEQVKNPLKIWVLICFYDWKNKWRNLNKNSIL